MPGNKKLIYFGVGAAVLIAAALLYMKAAKKKEDSAPNLFDRLLSALFGIGGFLLHGLISPARPYPEMPPGNYQLMIRSNAHLNHIPPYILFRIGAIESGFDFNVNDGAAGEIGIFQITPGVRQDFNTATRAGLTPLDSDVELSADDLRDSGISVIVVAWLLGKHYSHYNSSVELTVKAYNAGRGNVDSQAAQNYYNRFTDMAEFFPEGF
jgi:hypothetical protein